MNHDALPLENMKKPEFCVLGLGKIDRSQPKADVKTAMPIKTVIQLAKAPAPVGPYSQAVRVGNLLFCSGQIPLDARTGKLSGGDDIRAQTERVLSNLQTILAQEKLTLEHVVKTTVFLTNLNDLEGMNAVYGQYFACNCPARSTVQVVGLPRGVKVEIEAIACYPNSV
jgi:2-iminobutanoate/2-iminopropanoate deaminase